VFDPRAGPVEQARQAFGAARAFEMIREHSQQRPQHRGLATPGNEKPATCERRRCSPSGRGVLSPKCSDRVNAPRLSEWRDERLRGAIAIGAAILPPSAKRAGARFLPEFEALGGLEAGIRVVPCGAKSSASRAQSRLLRAEFRPSRVGEP
jgi:hypothetical protein